jgi:hypothetical protein
MKSITDPRVAEELVGRLEALRPDSPRHWGTLTPAEMLCHLGDAAEGVLTRRAPTAQRGNRILRWFALWSGLPWPKGKLQTHARVDPRREGTKPGDFEQDRARVILGVRNLAAAGDGDLAPTHMNFGPMRPADWHRWAWLHIDHHLRQFGL